MVFPRQSSSPCHTALIFRSCELESLGVGPWVHTQPTASAQRREGCGATEPDATQALTQGARQIRGGVHRPFVFFPQRELQVIGPKRAKTAKDIHRILLSAPMADRAVTDLSAGHSARRVCLPLTEEASRARTAFSDPPGGMSKSVMMLSQWLQW